MRRLIRAGLLAVARLGLFVTVAAWLVGQCVTYRLATHAQQRFFQIAIARDAWELTTFIVFSPTGSSVNSYVDNPEYLLAEPPADTPTTLGIMEDRTPVAVFPGVAIRRRYIQSLLIEHWLAIVVAALYYAVLKLSYRKRPSPPESKDAPCEA